MSIVKPLYTSNWGDQIGYPIASFLLPFVQSVSWMTPNKVTIISFIVFTFGCISLWFSYPFHASIAAVCIVLGYIGDDLDGQLARATSRFSVLGDYLDKVLDVLKIGIISLSLGYASYLQTQEMLYIWLGALACFFFMFRYYIKLETMFSSIDRDSEYLTKSKIARDEFLQSFEVKQQELSRTFKGACRAWWNRNKLFFAVDEAEFALITAVGALTNTLPLVLIFIAGAQVIIGFYRAFQRGRMLTSAPEQLLLPLRK